MKKSAVVLLAGAWLLNACGDDTAAPPQDQGVADLAVPIDLRGGPADLSGSGDGGGATDGGNVVDAFMCTASAFVSCNGNNAQYCNSTGNGLTSFDCGAACNATSMGCGQCTGDTCTGGQLTACDTAHQNTGATTTCVTLAADGNGSSCNSGGTACQQCSGTSVCGDGVSYGTSLNSQYACNGNGTLGAATPCALGCDPVTGQCRDLVPANDGRANVKAGDTFTCTGTQDATLAALTAGTGDTLTFDTTAFTIKKVNGPTTTDYTAMSKWGVSYKPSGSGTNAIVAHVKSVAVTAGATVVVTGSNALVLLVDGDASFAGAAGSTTIVKLAGTRASGAGPGAPTTTAIGAGGGVAGSVGGGGAGHGTDGAAGGQNSNLGTAGTGGQAYGGAAMTEALEAGATGGGNGTAAGGVGGGGLQVTACGTLTVGANVIFNASGGGGTAGGGTTATAGGTGGGSGGTILLEASSFAGNAVAGELVSNGAGGGGGGALGNSGGPGGEWDPTMTPTTVASGGTAGAVNAGEGGKGGVAGTAPTAGGNASTLATNGAGGGGGAVGRIFLNASPIATAPTATSASPAAKVSTTCVTSNGSPPGNCVYP